MVFGLRRKQRHCATPRDNEPAPAGALIGVGQILTPGGRPFRPSHEPAVGAGPPSDSLRVVVQCDGSALLVRAGGSVDASNIGVWRRVIGEAAGATTAPGRLIIDTDELEFMAVCAFVVLAEESVRCRSRGIELHLVSNQPVVARVLSAAGLEAELTFSANVDEALGRAPRPGPGPVLGS